MRKNQQHKGDQMTSETIEIQQDRKGYLIEKIEKLNKKARKLNCPEMVLTFGAERIRYELQDGRHLDKADYDNLVGDLNNPNSSFRPLATNLTVKRTYILIETTLDYEIPIIDGWELICTFDIEEIPDEEPMVLTSKVPDKTIPAEFLNKTEIHCDHCGWNRRRHHSMLMRNIESGEFKEVGSTCIKDFFGHSPRNFLWMAQISFSDIMSQIERDHGGAGNFNNYAYDFGTFMGMTAACIREYGWRSRGVAYEHGGCSTSDYVTEQLNPPTRLPRDWKWIEITDEDKELAKATIDHFLALDPEDNDYLVNCCKVAKLGYVPVKQIGVACSMVQTYKKHNKLVQEKAARPVSNWVGEVGDKLADIIVTCVYETYVESQFGTSHLFIFVDADGNKYKTFYSGHTWNAKSDGSIYNLKGTVKKHEEYKGDKSTMLTRCKAEFLKDETEAAGIVNDVMGD
jgi:hypothetical protein